jgi:manganese/zinc/iron transport system substrate-binding protein
MRRLVDVFVLLAILLLSSCGRSDRCDQSEELRRWMVPNGQLKVLCTTAMIADIARQVGGEHIDTLILISGQLDPHSYQLVKGDDEKLRAADLIIFNGRGLEHGPSLQRYLEESENAISLGNALIGIDPDLILSVEGQFDPHIWMDMSIWARTVDIIADALKARDPKFAGDYERNAKVVRTTLLEVHERIRKSLTEIPETKRYLVTSHDAFHYFTRAYLAPEGELASGEWKSRCAAPEGLAPDSMLSASDIREVINHMARYDIRVLFSESNVNKDSIRKIVDAATEEGMTIRIAECSLYGDAMGCSGSKGDTYIKMIEHNARVIAEQLR